jgi:hypothetical protein
MRRLMPGIGLLLIGGWLCTACSTSKPLEAEEMPPATMQCKTDCASVSIEYTKEHARLFARVIRLKAALKICQEKPR